MKFHVFIILLLLLSFANAADFSVGVSPDTVILGDVSPGEQKIVKFGIFSVSDEPLLIYLSSETGSFDFFNKGYKEAIPQFSEEPTASWIEFISNPVEINPEVKRSGRGWIDINLLLNVPKDAEPGYHVIHVIPMPTLYGGTSVPVGTSIVAVAKISILFKVKGEARREGLILDTTAGGYTVYGFTAKTFFQNTGTSTINARAIDRIYDNNGTFFGEFESANEYVEPGSIFSFETPVRGSFPEGEYRIESKVAFTTGETEKSSMINLYSPALTGEIVQQPSELPWLLALIILIIIIIVVRWLSAKKS